MSHLTDVSYVPPVDPHNLVWRFQDSTGGPVAGTFYGTRDRAANFIALHEDDLFRGPFRAWIALCGSACAPVQMTAAQLRALASWAERAADWLDDQAPTGGAAS